MPAACSPTSHATTSTTTKTVDAYLAAKKSFFDGLDKEAFALTNIDDRNGEVMLQNCPAAHRSYSLRSDADFRGRIVENAVSTALC